MKKFIASILVFLFLFGLFGTVSSQEKTEVNFFFSPTCPHCAKEKEFLKKLGKEYPKIEIRSFSVFEKKNVELLQKFYQKYKIPAQKQGLVPITFIGDNYLVGYQNEETTGEKIREYIANSTQKSEEPGDFGPLTGSLREIKIPILGKINLSESSPLALAITLGTLDGFNACAMLALGFLLAVLVATGLRRRVLVIGGTFILVSGIVYFIFITAWLNLFLVLPQMKLITVFIGAVVILFAVFLLKDYIHGVVCKLCEIKPGKTTGFFARFEQKLLKRMENISTSKMALPLVLLGVGTVAAGINLVELVCSLGFPLVLTKFLSSLSLSTFSYYFYLLVYIFFYMIDDLIVFLIALFTLRITQPSQKYLKAIKLISAVFLLILGILMIAEPGFLMFA